MVDRVRKLWRAAARVGCVTAPVSAHASPRGRDLDMLRHNRLSPQSRLRTKYEPPPCSSTQLCSAERKDPSASRV